MLRTAGKQRENVIWSPQAGCERAAGQCHSPESPPPCWQVESFLRSETGIAKLLCKDKEISYCFSHKYPFETDSLISTQCCLIIPALGSQSQKPLTWGSGQAQRRAVLLLKWDAVDKMQDSDRRQCVPCLLLKTFLSFHFCFVEKPVLHLAIQFPFLR